MSLARRLAAEALGTAFLLMVVIGSGIMGERLAAGNVALVLLANSLATGCGLGVLVLVFAPISGAHFNPIVTAAMATERRLAWRDALPYIAVQIGAALAGVSAAHLMFGEPFFSASTQIRTGGGQWWSEGIATFGLLIVILSCVKRCSAATPLAIAAYITAAYWFTSSTSFANPAVTLARAASDSFAGIRPWDAPAFIAAQFVGAAGAIVVSRWLWQSLPTPAPLPRSDGQPAHRD